MSRSFAPSVALAATRLLAFATLLPSCSSDCGRTASRAGPLTVVSRAPSGDAGAQLVVQVQFDRAIVDAASSAAAAPVRFIDLDPPLAGEAWYVGESTVAWQPTAPPRLGTTYTVTLRATARGGPSGTDGAPLADDVRWSFTTERQAVRDVTPASGTRDLASDATFVVAFLHAVDPAAVATAAHLRARPHVAAGEPDAPWRDLALDVTPEGAPEPAPAGTSPAATPAFTHVRLRPRAPLPLDHAIEIDLPAGLRGKSDGDAGMAHAFVISADTYGPLRIDPLACDGCWPGAVLTLGTSNPVDCAAALPHVTFAPAARVACLSERQHDLKLRVDLEGETAYTLTLRGGLTDIYGQRLGADTVLTLRTGTPRVEIARQAPFAIYTTDRADAHAEQVCAATRLRVRARPLDAGDLAPALAASGLAKNIDYRDVYDFYWDSYEWDDDRGDYVLAEELPPLRSGALDLGAAGTWPYERAIDVAAGNGWASANVPLAEAVRGGGSGSDERRGALLLVEVTPLDAREKPAGQPAFRVVNVTDLGLTAKWGAGELVVFAASLTTGLPQDGVDVTVLGDDGTRLGGGRTDAAGLARLPAASLLPGAAPRWPERFYVLAETKTDRALLSSRWSSYLDPWRFDLDNVASPDPEARDRVGLVFTERGVYRPGETLFIKGVLRDPGAAGLTPPPVGSRVTVRVHDGARDVVRQDAELGAFGTFDLTLALAADARLGAWTVHVGDDDATATFQVQEYRPVEFKVTVTPERAYVTPADRVRATIDGRFLFGSPMSGADLEWRLVNTWTRFESKRLPDYSFGEGRWWWWEDRDGGTSWLASDSATLDAQGRVEIDTPAGESRRGWVGRLTLAATVRDKSGQAVTGRTSLALVPGPVLPGLRIQGYLHEAGTKVPVELAAVTPDDAPAAGAKLAARLKRVTWRGVKRAGPGGGWIWESEREEVEQDVCEATTDAAGLAHCDVDVAAPGDYTVSVRLAEGGDASASTTFWATGDDWNGWGRNDGDAITLVTDRSEARPGDVVRVLARSPFKKARALVTIEREGVLDQWTTEVEGATPIEIKVKDTYIPNVYISVTLLRPRLDPPPGEAPDAERDKPAFKMGYARLRVGVDEKRLAVAVRADRERYEPGDTAEVTVDVRDARDRAVDAEVTFMAVDEGTLLVTGYRTPDPIAALYAPRPLRVRTAEARMQVVGQRTFAYKGACEGGGGDDGDDGAEEVRRDFRPVAHLVAAGRTDGRGRLVARFRLPDTLTAWRLMAVAVDAGERAGAGEATVRVAKSLMMRAALPRFARTGDVVQGGVTLNQTTGAPGRVTVTIEAPPEARLALRGPAVQEVDLAADATEVVRFELVAGREEGDVPLRFSASMGPHRDRVELVVPVRNRTPAETQDVAGVVTNASWDATLALPETAEPLSLEVTCSALPAADLEHRIARLIEYPYG